jgi:hypothetical protein
VIGRWVASTEITLSDGRRLAAEKASPAAFAALQRVREQHVFGTGTAAAIVVPPGPDAEEVVLLNPRITDASTETDEQYEGCPSFLPSSWAMTTWRGSVESAVPIPLDAYTHIAATFDARSPPCTSTAGNAQRSAGLHGDVAGRAPPVVTSRAAPAAPLT